MTKFILTVLGIVMVCRFSLGAPAVVGCGEARKNNLSNDLNVCVIDVATPMGDAKRVMSLRYRDGKNYSISTEDGNLRVVPNAEATVPDHQTGITWYSGTFDLPGGKTPVWLRVNEVNSTARLFFKHNGRWFPFVQSRLDFEFNPKISSVPSSNTNLNIPGVPGIGKTLSIHN